MFEGWAESFPGLEVVAVDLLDGLDVAHASHEDYAKAVVDVALPLPAPVALCGWSMGGLAVLQAAERFEAHSVVLLESSPPAEAQGVDESVEPRAGAFDPEEVYGHDRSARVAARAVRA